MTVQPIWSSGARTTNGFRAEVGVRFGDELEVELSSYAGGKLYMQLVQVIGRRDVAALADALYGWLRASPPGRGGIVVNPLEYAQLSAALVTARDLVCDRSGCGHRMGVHGIGTKPGRPSPCAECLCPAFR
jgi:hypothetical protein